MAKDRPKQSIVLVDNDRSDLRAWAKVLRGAGYDVQEASSVTKAKSLLAQGGFDLAVVDLHLESIDDEDDDSGLRIAEEYGHSLPVIILTGMPTLKLALRARKGRRPSTADFVEKGAGPDVLIRAVRSAILPKVFVSHGHDDGATSAVAKFLEDGGARPIVLREQPLTSLSILDSFEKYANVSFAVILVTPDDEGRRRGEEHLQPRARQNVIFELGFFLAKLGRDRVLCLYKQEGEPIEWPSNYQGILYREMDRGGGWKEQLRRDLSEAGIELDD